MYAVLTVNLNDAVCVSTSLQSDALASVWRKTPSSLSRVCLSLLIKLRGAPVDVRPPPAETRDGLHEFVYHVSIKSATQRAGAPTYAGSVVK